MEQQFRRKPGEHLRNGTPEEKRIWYEKSVVTRRRYQDLAKLAAAVTRSEIRDDESREMLARFGIREEDMIYGTLMVMEVFRRATRGNLRALKKIEGWLSRLDEE